MIQSLIALSLMMTLTFMFLSHPLSMGLILLIQAILISAITGTMSHNFWFSYILFMVMIGGMLVLFIYMTSVASNEKFLYSNKLSIVMTSIIMITMMMTIMIDQFPNYQMFTSLDMNKTNTMMMFSMSLSKYLNTPTNMIMVMMMIYLLITLIAIVKITNITYGPLRQKF